MEKEHNITLVLEVKYQWHMYMYMYMHTHVLCTNINTCNACPQCFDRHFSDSTVDFGVYVLVVHENTHSLHVHHIICSYKV